MNGHWSGRFQGSRTGTIIIDLDKTTSGFSGHVYFRYDDPSKCSYLFKIENRSQKTECYQIDSETKKIILSTREPLSFEIKLEESHLQIFWQFSQNCLQSEPLEKGNIDQPSEYQPIASINCWNDFKNYLMLNNYLSPSIQGRYIFRGQNTAKRLRTSFHRTGRADQRQYFTNDVKTLHRLLAYETNTTFNLNIPEESGAFFNLLQHHGYPTPLLDWTYSPYIAVFFAYRNIKNSEAQNSDPKRKVRLFIFDKVRWENKIKENPTFEYPWSYFSIHEFMAIKNQRMIPQQSVSSLSGVEDIESYIRSKETINEEPYLQVVELSVIERPQIMRDLSLMGINAGSLFPGIDGICEAQREALFPLR